MKERLRAGLVRCRRLGGAAWRWVRERPRTRLLALVPAVLLVGWLGWLSFEQSGVREGLEDAARNYVAMHRVRGYREELVSAGAEAGVDPYLLAGILWAESSGRLDVVSSAGALGLFQLKPITYEWRAELMGLPIPTREDILSDALLSARIAADNVAWLLDTYDGDVERMLFAYNAGPGRLQQLVEEAGSWERLRARSRRSGRSQVFAYVDKVLRYAEAFREKGLLGAEATITPPLLNASDS